MSLSESTAVVGGGRMGAGIAHALLLAGSEVVLLEVAEHAVGVARPRIADALRRSADHGGLDADRDSVAARLTVTTQAGALASAGLVVEAVPEEEAVGNAEAVIATNASSLPITRLAALLSRPRRAIGLHFLNPVQDRLLVEVVVGEVTAPRGGRAGDRVGADAGEDPHRRPRLLRLGKQPAGPGPRAGGHPDGGGGRCLTRGHRLGHDAGLQAPGRAAPAHRPGRPGRPPGHRPPRRCGAGPRFAPPLLLEQKVERGRGSAARPDRASTARTTQ